MLMSWKVDTFWKAGVIHTKLSLSTLNGNVKAFLPSIMIQNAVRHSANTARNKIRQNKKCFWLKQVKVLLQARTNALHNIFPTFEQLRHTFNLPQSHFFLQVRSYITANAPCFPLSLQDGVQYPVFIIFFADSEICMGGEDLGMAVAEEQWRKAASICARQFRVLHRLHFSKMFPGLDSTSEWSQVYLLSWAHHNEIHFALYFEQLPVTLSMCSDINLIKNM